MNQVSEVSYYLNTQQNTPNDFSWDSLISLLKGDADWMEGPQEAIEAQFQDYLNALRPYVTIAGGKTLEAYDELNTAFQKYKNDPEIGNAKIESDLSELQKHPLNLTDAQFQTATKTLLDQFHDLVDTGNVQGASDCMNILFDLTYNSLQLPKEYKDQFTSSTTPLMAAYNAFVQSLVTGGPPPTQKEIDDLLTQIDHLKQTV